jgi:hypothetical protein
LELYKPFKSNSQANKFVKDATCVGATSFMEHELSFHDWGCTYQSITPYGKQYNVLEKDIYQYGL